MEEVSLSTFVEGLFKPIPENSVVCLSYPSRKGAWKNVKGTTGKYYTLEGKEVYICSSLIRDAKKLNRKRESLTHTCVIVFDDIGTKAVAPPVTPTCIIETSKGNFQYIYKLQSVNLQEANNYALVSATLKAAARKGYTEDSGLHPGRVSRVPGSVNKKPGRNNFISKVTLWEPDNVWTLHTLIEALGLEILEDIPNIETIGEQLPKLDAEIEDKILTWLISQNLVAATRADWVPIICPWVDSHTPGRDDYAGYKPLGRGEMPLLRGFRCHHAHCAERTTGDFLEWVKLNRGPAGEVYGVDELPLNLIKNELENVTPEEKHALYRSSLPTIFRLQLPDCVKTPKGEPTASQLPTQANIQYLLKELEIHPKLNIMSREVELSFTNYRRKELLIIKESEQCHRTLTDIRLKLGIRGAKKHVDGIIEELASMNTYHPFEVWVMSKEWDGISRISELENTIVVAPQSVTAWPVYLRRWLLQGIQAGFGWRNPKQIALVLVFQGRQYLGKTNWFNSLAPVEFRQEGVALDLRSYAAKDSIIRATMFPLVELGEIAGTFRMSDVDALKNFLSQTHDVYRSPYGHRAIRWPRATSYFATVNRKEFLVDETGSRRFIPVAVKGIKFTHNIDMQQLWREVYEIWRTGEQWWLNEEESKLRAVSSSQFEQQEAAVELLDAWLATHTDKDTETLNVTEICRKLQISMNPRVKGIMTEALIKRLGPKAQINKKRNAWRLPVTSINTLNIAKEIL